MSPVPWLSPRATFVLVGAAAFAAVGIALVSQHSFKMQPCPWCVLQRLIFIVIGVVALLAALVPARGARLAGAALVTALAVGGIASALWQHFVAAKSSSCNLTFADRIVSGAGLDVRFPSVFEVRANCSEAATTVLGIAYEFWSLGLFVILIGAVWFGLRRR